MKKLRPVYRDIKDWAILDERTIYDFSENKNPIQIVKVLIGTLHYEYIGINQCYEERRTPIIRWITKKNYEQFQKNEGVVIW